MTISRYLHLSARTNFGLKAESTQREGEEFQTPIRQREMQPCSAHPSLDRHAPARFCW